MMGKKRQNRGKPNKYLTEDDKKNDLFHHYYKTQFNWSDEKIDKFYETMLSELPATFRVTGFREQSTEVLWLIKNKFLDQLITGATTADSGVPLAKPLPWFPKEMAWQLNATKVEIRKQPQLKKLHKFLVSETECGFISRQEAVSMLPPLLLDIEGHHRVLDLCAAPGSKTAQLIEMLHSKEGTALPTGVIVANDIDNKRCYMMVHQLQRLQSPCVVVVRQDASIFPKIFIPDSNSKTGESQMQFDRILADVPCSGDGTLRKNPDLWPRWTPSLGVNEHFLQMKILRRSLEMLAEGGRMVYSTCSLNPLEDEAVIAAVLSQCHGSVRLIDIGDRLPSLVAEPGLSEWRVMLKDKTWCSRQEDVPEGQRRSFRATLFPPENVEQLHLEYCRRVLPQLQNTGGFFIALLEKNSCLPWMNPAKQSAAAYNYNNSRIETDNENENGVDNNILNKEEDIEKSAENSPEEEIQTVTTVAREVTKEKKGILKGGPPKKKSRVYKEDPFYYLQEGDENWEKVRQYYDIGDKFPHRQLMYRNAEGKRRNYYFTNELVKQLVESNQNNGINFVNLGVKAFGISEDKMFQGYRLLQEGIESIEPFIGEVRRMTLPCKSDLLNLLAFDMPLISSFSKSLQEEFVKFSIGPVLFQYDPEKEIESGGTVEMPRIKLVFAGWRGFSSLRHYVGVHERSHLLRLCGEEPVEVEQASRWQEEDVVKEEEELEEDVVKEEQLEEETTME